jgi:hypothetical protein
MGSRAAIEPPLYKRSNKLPECRYNFWHPAWFDPAYVPLLP